MNQIFFFNVGRYKSDSDSYLEWKSPQYQKSSFFDVKLTRNAPEQNIFYTITKIDLKIVYYVQEDVVFSIGADSEVQTQLLEALVEHLIKLFFDAYDKALLNTCYGDSFSIFSGFNSIIRDTFKNYEKLDLFKTALTSCKGCGKNILIVIKKSLIQNSSKPTTPLVIIHSGHALLTYIDLQYKVRGAELVNVSY